MHNLLTIYVVLTKLFRLTYAQETEIRDGGTWNNASSVQQSIQHQTPPSSSGPFGPRRFRPEDFSKLKLKVEQLFGSRWAMEQKSAIDVYHSIEVVDATLMTKDELILRIEFNLRQTWVAEGLEFPEGLFKANDTPKSFVTADEGVLANMWSPDSYISTSRESNMNTVGTPLSLVYIFKNATIIFKVRMFTKVACSSNFQWYPLDVQSCDLTIESYKYHDNIVRYHWTDEKMYRPVVVHTRRLFQYELQKPPKFDSGKLMRGGRGMNYSFVRVKFRFERRLGNNLIQVYTPTVLVVVLSWFSFWLGLDAIPGRISLLVTCVLTLVTMHSGLKSSIPPVHYVTMMDVWYVCCMAFVFSAMSEFVVAKYLHWRYQQRNKLEEKRYEKETRERLYSIFQQQQQQSFEEWRNARKRSSARSLRSSGNKSELFVIRERDKVFPSYWDNKADDGKEEGHIQKVVNGDLLRSINENGDEVGGGSVGDDTEVVDNDDDGISVGSGRLGDEEEGNLGKDEECKGKQAGIPIWVVMDRYCRGGLPLLFCLFNGIYWPVLYGGSAAQDTEVYAHNL